LLAIEHGLQRGYATSISGFKRFITNGGRQQENALRNHPIQSSAMTIFKKALMKVDREYRGTEVLLLLPRHDSILIECPCEMKADVITRARALMIEAAKEVFPSMQARVTDESGQSWPTDRTLEKELESLRGKRKEAQQNE
jgi:DNA polymerase I-like protein with 3'-5' exonuclease and polymerase domains